MSVQGLCVCACLAGAFLVKCTQNALAPVHTLIFATPPTILPKKAAVVAMAAVAVAVATTAVAAAATVAAAMAAAATKRPHLQPQHPPKTLTRQPGKQESWPTVDRCARSERQKSEAAVFEI